MPCGWKVIAGLTEGQKVREPIVDIMTNTTCVLRLAPSCGCEAYS